jgi:hypothetical protein
MFSDIITQEAAKKTAIEIIKTYNIPPIIWNEELRELQFKYWKIHGFNISKIETIKKQKELIEYLELESIITMRHNPNIESQKNILDEIEKLQESDLKK